MNAESIWGTILNESLELVDILMFPSSFFFFLIFIQISPIIKEPGSVKCLTLFSTQIQ